MGHVEVTIRIENYLDWAAAQQTRGKKKPRIRTALIPDALVDTGTTYLCLPARYIKALGLIPYPKSVSAQTASGTVHRRIFGGALLTIEDRSVECTVIELPDNTPALLGVIPLEALDFVIDPVAQKLVGKHGRKQVCLLY